MFSSTVSRGKIRVSWKVRPMPAANTLSGAGLVIAWSPNQTWPSSGRWYPVMTLNSVVLPEPFGPIRPATVPSSTAIVAPFSAWTPP